MLVAATHGLAKISLDDWFFRFKSGGTLISFLWDLLKKYLVITRVNAQLLQKGGRRESFAESGLMLVLLRRE